MKSEYRIGLLLLAAAALLAAIIMSILHHQLVNPGVLDSIPDADAVINSHARLTLAYAVAFGSFIVWMLVGALTGREPATGSVAGSDDEEDDEVDGLPGNRVTITPKRLQTPDES